MKITQMTLEQIYLDWVNNFLSGPAFAEHYNLELDDALDLLNLVEKLFNHKIK